jgi:predicted alpha/beta hydrolase
MMRLSRFLTSAASALNDIAPDRAAAWASAALAFLLALILLGNTLEGAAAGTQMLATSLGAVIAAFLASRLAAYLVRVVGLWAGWPELNRRQQLAVALAMALGSATFVLLIMILLS